MPAKPAMTWSKLLSAKSTRRVLSGKPPDDDGGDFRNPFEKDLGKVIFSTPFRRLQDKAQVFPLEAMDGVRNRASHSMEVANVARDLAKVIAGKIPKKTVDTTLTSDQAEYIRTIAYVGGLLHDLGNPPFGHAGEDAIKMWFQSKTEGFWKGFGLVGKHLKLRDDFLHFDGNAQTLRLVSRLQAVSDLNGLNLTAATFASLVKYEAGCGNIKSTQHLYSKLGHFKTEEKLLALVRKETGSEGRRHPMTFIIEAADDIVYGVVDVEDGIKKGVIKWADVTKALDETAKLPNFTANQRELCTSLHGKTKSFIDSRLSDLPPGHLNYDEAYVQYFRTLLIKEAVSLCSDVFIENYAQIMRGGYKKELIKDSDLAAVYHCLKKKVGGACIYQCKEAVELEVLGISIIQGLMDIFIKAFIKPTGHATTLAFNKKIMSLFSTNYCLAYEEARKSKVLPDGYLQLRLLTDYICGMTDNFALNLYRKLSRER
jgi:dGTPase